MSLTLLVVDDDPYIRQFVRRVMSADGEVRLLEAHTGIAALDVLMTEHVDVMLLDMSMPVMTGIETLESVRRSEQFRDLPVVLLTGRADEARVSQAAALGVSGFLVKPVSPTLLRDRIARVVHDVTTRASTSAVRLGGLDLRAGSRVVVADRAPDFCHLFARELASLCDVAAVHTVADALTTCVDNPPDAVFIGSVDRVLETELCVRKLRQLRGPRATRVVGLFSPSETATDTSLFDAVIPRSYVRETLREHLQSTLTEQAAARWALGPGAPLGIHFAAAVAASLEGALGKVTPSSDGPPEWAAGRARWVGSAVEVYANTLAWDLNIQLPYESALPLAAAIARSPSDAVFEKDVCEAIGTWASRSACILTDVAANERVAISIGTPRTSVQAACRLVEQPGSRDRVQRWWYSFSQAPHGAFLTLAPLGDA